jgi:hypothetical protein
MHITDERLKTVAANKRIEYLNLQGCAGLTDESLSMLAQADMPNLKSLRITAARPGPPFSAEAVNEFKAKKPGCKVW